MSTDTHTLPARKVFVVSASPLSSGAVVRLSDQPSGSSLLSGRLASYDLVAGGVLAFGPFAVSTRWAISSDTVQRPTYAVSEPVFVPVATIESALADLNGIAANPSFAYSTEAGFLRWIPPSPATPFAGGAWQNVADAPGAPVSIVSPGVAGEPEAGEVLAVDGGEDSASIGSFWLNVPTSFTYQWLNNGAAIGGEVAQTYTVLGGDVGEEISCRVTVTNAFGEATATTASVLIV